MNNPSAILMFAAGLGTRMGTLTVDKPKPLVKVSGQTLFDHALTLTLVPEVHRRVVNVHYKADLMRAHIADSGVEVSDESDRLLDTGGGLRHALPLMGSGPVLTLNTDAIWRGNNPVQQLLDAWNPEMEALLMLIPKRAVHGHVGPGDFALSDSGRLNRSPGDVYAGLQIIKPGVLNEIPEDVFSMNRAWDIINARGGLYGHRYDGQWCDVGRPESIPIAEALLNV